MGPAAGVHGGEIIAEGTPADIMAAKKSVTGQYLTGMRSVPVPAKRRKAPPNKRIKVVGAKAHNLQNISVAFPLGFFTFVTGVPGGGKSTPTIDTLYKRTE